MLGHAVLAAAAVASLTALLTASELGYAALRIAGALSLIYLGVQSVANFVRLRRSDAGDAPAHRHAQPTQPATGRIVRVSHRQGLLSNSLNPKQPLFTCPPFPSSSCRA